MNHHEFLLFLVESWFLFTGIPTCASVERFAETWHLRFAAFRTGKRNSVSMVRKIDLKAQSSRTKREFHVQANGDGNLETRDLLFFPLWVFFLGGHFKKLLDDVMFVVFRVSYPEKNQLDQTLPSWILSCKTHITLLRCVSKIGWWTLRFFQTPNLMKPAIFWFPETVWKCNENAMDFMAILVVVLLVPFWPKKLARFRCFSNHGRWKGIAFFWNLNYCLRESYDMASSCQRVKHLL